MVYELTVQSVKLKSTLFTPPSRLINTCEATYVPWLCLFNTYRLVCD